VKKIEFHGFVGDLSAQRQKYWKSMQIIIRINFVIFSHCHYKLFYIHAENLLFDLSIIIMPRYFDYWSLK